MRKLRYLTGVAAIVAAVLGFSAPSGAQQYGMMGGQCGMMGQGMMGSQGMMGGYGQSPMMGGGCGMMGPGMMGHQGMMGGGQGMMGGPGMMGGQGMMGGGQGMMGHNMMGGPGSGTQANLNLSTDYVKNYLGRWIAVQGNTRLKVGDVKEKDADTIIADIVTKENSLVQRFIVDRRTGFYRPDEG